MRGPAFRMVRLGPSLRSDGLEHEPGDLGMADVIFLAVGGGAFVAFAVLAVFLNKV